MSSSRRSARAAASQAELAARQAELTELDDEIDSILDGSHVTVVANRTATEHIRDERLRRLQELHQARVHMAKVLYDAEAKQAEEQCEQERVREKLLLDLQKKRKRVEAGRAEGMVTRKKGRLAAPAADVDVPSKTFRQIRFTLTNEEISSDLSVLRKPYETSRALATQVWVEGDSLHYHGTVFTRYHRVTCESKGQNLRGIIASIEPHQIHIQTTSRLEIRIWIAHLRNGTWSLSGPE